MKPAHMPASPARPALLTPAQLAVHAFVAAHPGVGVLDLIAAGWGRTAATSRLYALWRAGVLIRGRSAARAPYGYQVSARPVKPEPPPPPSARPGRNRSARSARVRTELAELIWRTLRQTGTTTAADLAAHLGRPLTSVRWCLRLLEQEGAARRNIRRHPPKTGTLSRQRYAVWTAEGESYTPAHRLTVFDAVREVLKRGPVVGRAEVARQAGYSVPHVDVALRALAIRESQRVGLRSRYRLRDAP